jgi:polyhydroxyalkanoate synthesis regulator phasin
MVLAKEAEMVKSLVEEGLLTPKHAEEFLEEISEDTHRIEKERNQLYR